MLYSVLLRHSAEMVSWAPFLSLILFQLIAILNAAGPNIVFIIADDLGWSDVGFHSGDVKTPNIDALAYNGIILKRHYSQSLCTPSRTALLTGDYPIRHGMQGTPSLVADGLPAHVQLMPKYFSELGYKTHLVGKWHLGYETREHLPTQRGFDTFFGYLNGYLGYWDGTHQYNDKPGRDFRRNEKRAWREVYGKYLTEVLTNEAVKVIEDHDDSEKLLLFVCEAAVHTTMLSMEREAPPSLTNNTERGILRDMARWMDWSVGEIITSLEKKGILNDTIVIFISDNGAPTEDTIFHNKGSNWPFRGQKASTHEGGVRTVGLVYSSIFQRAPRVSEELFHITDWFPTLYAAAGGDLKYLKVNDGINQWLSLLTASEGPRKELLLDIDDNTKTEAYIMGKWKLLRNHHPESGGASADRYHGESGEWMTYDIEEVKNSTVAQVLGGIPDDWTKLKSEVKVTGGCSDKRQAEDYDCHTKYCLYDLIEDPTECHDVAAQNSTLVQELKGRLDFYREVLVSPAPKFFDKRADPKKFNDYWSPWLDSNDILF